MVSQTAARICCRNLFYILLLYFVTFFNFTTDKFHQAVVKALESYIRNTDAFLKTGTHLERFLMLNKTVEMARGVHGTINMENRAPNFTATDFDTFARCYKERLAVFAAAQQDIHKMVISLPITFLRYSTLSADPNIFYLVYRLPLVARPPMNSRQRCKRMCQRLVKIHGP